MRPTVPLMMFGWIPFVAQLFLKLTHRRATIASIILAWMFLPQYAYTLPVLPDYDKTMAASLAVLFATYLYASGRFSTLKLDWYDGIMALWCLTPMFASLTNGLGAYDGFAASNGYVTTWFLPYLVGRLYITDWAAVKDLVWGIFFGGLIYIPLCWIEILLSPQLHMWVYGWHPHDFIQSVRGNSFRPVIFMHHGLMVGMWMAAACLCGIGLYMSGSLPEMSGLLKKLKVPAWLKPTHLLFALLVTFLACQSVGALALLIQAGLVFFLCRKFKTKLFLLLLIAYPAYSMTMSLKGGSGKHGTVDFIRTYISEDRAASLEFRLNNEEILVERALQRPTFGWGGWGRSRVLDEEGVDISVTDAYWIIVFGTTGIVGLASFVLVVSVPTVRLLQKFPVEGWRDSGALLVMPLAILLPIYAQDCLLNDMKNPIYMVIAGGLITMTQVPGLLPLLGLTSSLTPAEKPLPPYLGSGLPRPRYI
jgi:hypothetical protein